MEPVTRCVNVCFLRVPLGLMADKESTVPVGEEEDETDLNYQPPAQKSLQEIQELDKDDESLNKYKQTLLGSGPVVTGQCPKHLFLRVPSIHSSIQPCIHPSIYLFINQSTIHLCTHSSTNQLSIYTPIHPSIHPSILNG